MTEPIWTMFSTATAFLVGLLACRALVRRHWRLIRHLPDADCIDRAGPVDLGGASQWVSIRGHNRNNPVLLFLHGGPGTCFGGIAYSHQAMWEEYFTVVNWDQRGSGRSRIRGAQVVELEDLINDAVELIDYLRQELTQDKVFLLGHSWGGFLALTIAHRRPELLHACIGLAPLLGLRAGYSESHRVLTVAATAAGDEKALKRLRHAGPELPAPGDPAMHKSLGAVVGLLPGYGLSWHNQTSMTAVFARVITIALFSPDLKLHQIHHPLGGSRSYALGLLGEIYDMYLPDTLGAQFETSVILVSGEFDQQAPINLVRQYYEKIKAPSKAFRILRGSAHAAVWEAPGQILEVLLQEALPLADCQDAD